MGRSWDPGSVPGGKFGGSPARGCAPGKRGAVAPAGPACPRAPRHDTKRRGEGDPLRPTRRPLGCRGAAESNPGPHHAPLRPPRQTPLPRGEGTRPGHTPPAPFPTRCPRPRPFLAAGRPLVGALGVAGDPQEKPGVERTPRSSQRPGAAWGQRPAHTSPGDGLVRRQKPLISQAWVVFLPQGAEGTGSPGRAPVCISQGITSSQPVGGTVDLQPRGCCVYPQRRGCPLPSATATQSEETPGPGLRAGLGGVTL